MQNNHPYGSPLTVLNFSDDFENPTVNMQLVKMFEHPDVKTSKIVAISVVGPYRKGKSLFLNYCLRFLYAHYPSINFINNPTPNPKEWMGAYDEPLVGFSWRSGSNPDTKGILIWNDVFLHTNEAGDRIGIVLIDSQGLFTRDSSQTDDSKIFALGTLISSIQVFNLSGVVQEDQLQYLQFAAEYAKFGLNNEIVDEKPFQKLFFLIRDWDNHQEYPFGCIGGQKYLQRFFNSKKNRTDELKSVYEFINNLYQDLSCSLLPNPGKYVTQGVRKNQNEKYDGSLAGMDEEFREELAKVIEQILSPENQIPKRFNGKYLNGAEFLDHMQHYFKFYLTNELPEVQTMLESIVENEMKSLLSKCFNKYKEEYRKSQASLLNLEEMKNHHESCKANILILFEESIKIGNPEVELKYKQKLVGQLDCIYQENVKQFEANEKRIEEENNKIQKEVEMKYAKELEEHKRHLDAQKKQQEMELQKMKDDLEQTRKSAVDEITKTRMQSEKDLKDSQQKYSTNINKYHLDLTVDDNMNLNDSGYSSQFQTNETPKHGISNGIPRNNFTDCKPESYQSNQIMQSQSPSGVNLHSQKLQYQPTYYNEENTQQYQINQQQYDRDGVNSYRSNAFKNDESTSVFSYGNVPSWTDIPTKSIFQNPFKTNDQIYPGQCDPFSKQEQFDTSNNSPVDFCSQPIKLQKTNPFYYDCVDEYGQQVQNQQFISIDQQFERNTYNPNQSRMMQPINGNYPQSGGQYIESREIGQHFQRQQQQPAIMNHNQVPFGQNQIENYGTTGSQSYGQMQPILDQQWPSFYLQNNSNHQGFNEYGSRSNEISNTPKPLSENERRKLENEKEMQERAKRIADRKAKIDENSEREIEESRQKLLEMQKLIEMQKSNESWYCKFWPLKKSPDSQINKCSEPLYNKN